MDLGPLPEDLIASYVGNGAPVLLRRAMGPEASDEQVATALDYFIRYYHEHCLDKTVLYPGALDTLRAAHEKKIHLAILTNKPVRISNVILEGLGVKELFFQVYGGNSFPTKKPDPQGLRALIEESKSDAASTVMVGDSSVDIMTARNANVYAVGMTYGLSPESLREVPPDMLLHRMDELIPHL
jgi:phosphoglycolate phosphatase